MKRYIKADSSFWEQNQEFVPNIDFDFVEDTVIPELKSKLTDRFGKRYKNISIDLDDIRCNSSRVVMDVAVYNKDVLKTSGEFNFLAYTEYWDELDFKSHLSQKISEFVKLL